MKQRIITGAVFTVIIVAFLAPAFFWPIFILLLTAVVSIIATFELIRAVRVKNKSIMPWVVWIGSMMSFIPALTYFCVDSPYVAFVIYALPVLVYVFVSTMVPPILKEDPDALNAGVASSSLILYISFPIACANIMALYVKHGWYFVVLGLFSPWISDVFAYFTGSFFGKHKICPHISPKKTWEGCIGGAVCCAIVTGLFFALVMNRIVDSDLPFALYVALATVSGLILSVVSQLGDWLASAIKRMVGIKDYGNIMPGHGGVMDRFDSAFFTLPIAFAMALLLV